MIALPLLHSIRVSFRRLVAAADLHSRRVLTALLVPFSMMIASCSPDYGLRQYANAVGPDLYDGRTIHNTALLHAYTSSLCQQAGIAASDGRCVINDEKGWKTFVDMGLYDIDQRCDAFLDSLYYKDKSQDAVLAQISGTRSLASSVLNAAAASSVAIRIVAAAFDFSESSFRNVNTTLLQALDPTTVKSIVFKRQKDVKTEIYAASISNLPQALHALRTYLRMCMPFTIEMEANAVLTTFQRTGETGNSLIGFTDKPQTADSVPHKPSRSLGTDVNVVALFGAGSAYRPKDVETVQRKLCAEPTGKVDEATKAAVSNFREYKKYNNAEWHVLTSEETKAFLGNQMSSCNRSKYLKYFETVALSGYSLNLFIQRFNLIAEGDQKISDEDVVSSKIDSKFRQKIISFKNSHPNFAESSESLKPEVTHAFFQKLIGGE